MQGIKAIVLPYICPRYCHYGYKFNFAQLVMNLFTKKLLFQQCYFDFLKIDILQNLAKW
jgi:hypothetical protein